MSRVKVVYESEAVDADEVTFQERSRSTGSYELADGAVINIAQEVKNVYRLCDKRKADGSPIYLLMGAAAIKTIPAAGKE